MEEKWNFVEGELASTDNMPQEVVEDNEKDSVDSEALALISQIVDENIGEDTLDYWVSEELLGASIKILPEDFSLSTLIGSKGEKKLWEELVASHPGFFASIDNIIYFKLASAYEKGVKTNGEDQDVYYAIEKFQPNESEVAAVAKTLSDLKEGLDYKALAKGYFKENFDPRVVTGVYNRALELAQVQKAEAKEEDDAVSLDGYDSAISSLTKVTGRYTDEASIEYVADVHSDILSQSDVRLRDDLSLPVLVSRQCGRELTDLETIIMDLTITEAESEKMSLYLPEERGR